MKKKDYKFNKNIVAAFLVLKKENQVLLLKRQNTGYGDGKYGLVSGHVESGESFQKAMMREAKEEANIVINEKDILRTHIQHRKSLDDRSERVDAYFLVEKWQGEIKNNEPYKCAELKWFSIEKLPSNTIKAVRAALDNIFDRIPYSEFGWDWQLKSKS